jgi:predicted ABC-type ATPase
MALQPGERTVIILAGPNGAGKSTAASTLLPRLQLLEFVNADTIARGLSEFNPESAAHAAARIMLQRIDRLTSEGRNLAFETTLASRTFAPRLRQLRAGGYRVELIFCWLPSPEMCVERVAFRVRSGGHSVPEDTVHRRYHAGLRNFFRLYGPLVDAWRFYETAGPRRLIAEFETELIVYDGALWNKLKESYGTGA